MSPANKTKFQRPLNVYVGRGSSAERALRLRSGSVVPEAIAPGLPPTPEHDLRFYGGKTIQYLNFVNYYIAANAWAQDDIDNIDRCLAAAMSDEDLNNVIAQYFTGPIASAFAGSQKLPGQIAPTMSQGDVEKLATDLFSQNQFNAYDLASTVFNFLLPPGTVLNTDSTLTGANQLAATQVQTHQTVIPHDEDDSLNGLGGYHGSVHVTGGAIVYYAVGVYSQVQGNGTINGIPVFDQPWKNIVATFYHELNESRTDADVEDAIRAGNDPNANAFLGWVSDQGEECGDFPVTEAAGDLAKVFEEVQLTSGVATVPVQFQYSNFVHGPEGPIAVPYPTMGVLRQGA